MKKIKMSRGVTLTFEEEIRSAPTHRAHTTIALGYTPIPYLNIYAGYTLKLYGNQGWTDPNKYLQHRANFLMTGQVKLGQWNLSLREGVMLDGRTGAVDKRVKNQVDFTLRSRLQAVYAIPETPLSIVGKFELLNTLNAPITYINENISAGYYILKIQLQQEGYATTPAVEYINTYSCLIRVAPGLTSYGVYTLDKLAQLYTITYKLNEGTFDSTTSAVPTSYNAYTSFALPTPTRNGYEFAGWYTQESNEDI